MVRMLPRVNRLLLDLLRPALAPVPVYSEQPDLSRDLPVVMARKVPGDGAPDPRFLDRCLVDVQCWHSSDADTDDLAETARVALVTAWRTQQIIGGLASIAGYTEISSPARIPDETTPKGVVRYQATYQLAIRPA
ncbi:hypothetical protein BJF83_17305 [Nocardiopsis sp. CNR-923]|uniref:hypothetical protein n=1 Tax=Nocardiopsis sp. CNR-923 TaxID=1904965 RepID=UPI00096648F1|nr:hypothetical protein [Nocardiopsis sp. CNR-923]OLT27744.1 hypothetical protein BJF83_17305 [Nocardiopsis sp. CNR-923]